MIPQLLTLLPPMLLGAQLLLTLILVKGEICPGQRGRIHKVLPALAILWLAVASVKIQSFLIVFALAYFYSQVQTKKTREQGPLWVMYLANGLALAYVGILVSEQLSLAFSVYLFLLVPLLGASFAHLLLIIAKTRLQAFHRILPVVGVVSSMLVCVTILLKAYGFDAQQLTQVTPLLLIGLALMISAVVVWCWHIFTHKAAHKLQLFVAMAMMLSASVFNFGLFAL